MALPDPRVALRQLREVTRSQVLGSYNPVLDDVPRVTDYNHSVPGGREVFARLTEVNDDYDKDPSSGYSSLPRSTGSEGGESLMSDKKVQGLLIGWFQRATGVSESKIIGNGSYGLTLLLEGEAWQRAVQRLDGNVNSFNRTYSSQVSRGGARRGNLELREKTAGRAVVKLQVLQSRNGRRTAVKEDLVLRYINQVHPSRLRARIDNCETLATGEQAFPEFLYGCTMWTPSGVFRLSFLSYLEGSLTLGSFLVRFGTRAFTVRHYVQLERALMTLWLAGFVHGDVHDSNVMMVPRAGAPTEYDPYLIDLGFAVRLPEEVVKEMADLWRVDYLTERMRMFTRAAVNVVRTRLIQRGYKSANPDWKFLAGIRQVLRLSDADILRERQAFCSR